MRNLTKQIGVRVVPRDYKLLQEISKGRGIDVSDFVRQLIRVEFAKLNYLGDDAKKALGVSFEGGE